MNIYKRFIVNVLANSQWIPIQIRTKLYNWMGIRTNQSEIRPGCFFNSEFVNIGTKSFINFYSQFHSGYDERGVITLGERCYIGMNVNFCTISHELGDSSQRAGKNTYEPITVGNGTWIGANSIILPGVEIAEGCVIAAGSVVTKDCEANSLYAGNPARKIKDLPHPNLKVSNS
ncbi:acyltransferase [Exiguobacterium sp. s128]|uniref:acyltransferase n=1 Tax=unclassified Exiguobacterium TaxID=2644629 RepID=UPI001AE474DD